MSTQQPDLAGELGIGRLFELLPDAVIVGDPTTGLITHWNPAATTIFGYQPDEAVGLPLDRIVAPEQRDAHRAGIRRFALSGRGQIVDSGDAVEVRALTKDLRRLWVELRINSLRTDEGKLFVLAVIRDISDRRALQERLETAAAAEEARSASLRRFVSMAAHDLRGPLGLIDNFLQFVAEDQGLAEGTAELVTRCQDLSRRANRLAEDMLGLLLLEAGADIAEPEHLAVADALALAFDTSDLVIAVQPGTAVWADPRHVSRILMNLLSNARKYGAPPIVITAGRDGDEVGVTVRDHGPGVPADQLPTMFEAFTRGAAHRAIPGAGLGLAAVRMLAQLNGGDISYSPADPGAEFTLRLPAGEVR